MHRLEPKADTGDPIAPLIGPVLDRDARAIEAWVRATAPSATRVVRQILGATHPDVADVTQEALFAALEALPGFRAQAGLRCADE